MTILALAAGVAGAQKLPATIELGASLPMPQLELADATREDDAAMTLASAATERGLVVIFTSNTCPFVVGNGPKSEGWEGRYRDLTAFAKRCNVGIVYVNSNEAKRSEGESMEAMRQRAKNTSTRLSTFLTKAINWLTPLVRGPHPMCFCLMRPKRWFTSEPSTTTSIPPKR